MKKVLSILVALALVISCCSIAVFASEVPGVSRTDFLTFVGDQLGIPLEDDANYNLKGMVTMAAEKGIYDDSTDFDANVTTEEMTDIIKMVIESGSADVDMAKGWLDGMAEEGAITAEQKDEIATAIEGTTTGGDTGGDTGDGDGGSILDNIDLSNITDIFSNLGDIDFSKFLEGAKSSLGQLLDGIKGAGLPDLGSLFGGLDMGSLFGGDGLSSITGLLSGLPLIGDLFSMFGGGGDDSGSGSGSGSSGSGSSGSGLINGGTGNTTTIPKTADNAPYVAVASLAVLAGVAFVLTRKKNEE